MSGCPQCILRKLSISYMHAATTQLVRFMSSRVLNAASHKPIHSLAAPRTCAPTTSVFLMFLKLLVPVRPTSPSHRDRIRHNLLSASFDFASAWVVVLVLACWFATSSLSRAPVWSCVPRSSLLTDCMVSVGRLHLFLLYRPHCSSRLLHRGNSQRRASP